MRVVSYLLHSGNPKMLRSPSRPAPALSRPGTDQPNDRRDAGTAARAPFRRSLDATRSPGLRRPLHADGPACLPQARTATGWGYLSEVNSQHAGIVTVTTSAGGKRSRRPSAGGRAFYVTLAGPPVGRFVCDHRDDNASAGTGLVEPSGRHRHRELLVAGQRHTGG